MTVTTPRSSISEHSPYSNDDYHVGWISALPLELAAASGMLDEKHGVPREPPQTGDNNSYVLGRIHKHNVVIACLPRGEVGVSSAAIVARDMLGSFPNIRIGLMVGIGAGIPRCTSNEGGDDDDEENDVHLGDVVISSDKKTGGVVAYNFGKKLADGSFEVAYHLNQPPRVLRTALAQLEAAHEFEDTLIPKYLDQMLEKVSGRIKSKWTHPGLSSDILFPPDYLHAGGKTCKSCDSEKAIRKADEVRDDNIPTIHYGVIATGSEVVKHAPTRDRIRSEHNAICLEMEAAGLMNNFPCLVIRGISDYADSHKNDQWHRYAAAVAAACGKELLGYVQPADVQSNPKASKMIQRLDNIQRRLSDVDSGIKAIATASHQEQLKKWLAAPDPETNLNQSLEDYHQGTGLWFLQSTTFREWTSTISQSLWIRGIPGSGKTILSSKAIHNFLSEHASANLPPPIYFFFDTRDSSKQTRGSMLRSLMWQVYKTFEKSAKLLDALFLGRFERGDKQLSSRDLVSIFLTMAQSSETPFKIVLDALDESSTQSEVLDWIKSFKSQHPEVGFLITSRQESLIESGIRDWLDERFFVTLRSELVNIDITEYIRHSLQTDRSLSRWKNFPSITTQIEDGITSRADGMFRLAACQLEVLKTCVDLGEVENEIKRLPTTLQGIYDSIFRKIGDHHRPRVIRILQFLVYSQRPLRIQELVDAAAVDLARDPEFEPHRRMPDPHGILEICPSLIAARKSALNNDDEDENSFTEIIELAHATVKEYLVSLKKANEFYDIADPIKAQGTITSVCLAYLSHLDEQQPRDKIQADFPLAKFSSRYWLQHARGSDKATEVREMIIRFLTDSKTRQIWSSFYNPDFPWEDAPRPYTMAAPIYYASLAGLTHTVEWMLKTGSDPTLLGGVYGNALEAASVGGHEDVVKLLLNRGVDVNLGCGMLGNALQAAATHGSEDVIRLLLQSGAKINAEGGKYGNAVQAASSRSNQSALQVLISHGANLNFQGGKYGNALFVAALNGDEPIVRLLLDNGTSCNMKSPQHGTPLQAAAGGGHREIVKHLLRKGAQIDQVSGLYGTGLQMAASQGAESVVRLLLENGANPNLQGGLFGNSLQVASAKGYDGIVTLLLDNSANPNALSGFYRTALQAASVHGHISIVKLLLNRGASTDVPEDGETKQQSLNFEYDNNSSNIPSTMRDSQTLQYLQNDHIEKKLREFQDDSLLVNNLLADQSRNKIVSAVALRRSLRITPPKVYEIWEQLLRGKILKKRLRDEFHHTPLQAASAQGHAEIVELLLDAGVEVNTNMGLYGTALQAASAEGHERIVTILINGGAELDIRGGFYGTAIQAASTRGHHGVVKLLLENGANPRAQGVFDDALQAASARGHHEIVETLLEFMGYINVCLEEGFLKALCAACAGGYTLIVDRLLKLGLQMDTNDKFYIVALRIAVENGHEDIVRMLLRVGVDINTDISNDGSVLQTASRGGKLPLVELLLDSGADIHQTGGSNGSPVHAAAFGGHVDILRLLIERGADVSRELGTHRLPILAAINGGKEDAFRFLFELGASSNSIEDIHVTIFEKACEQGHESIVRMLLASRKQMSIDDYWQGDPLYAAAKRGHNKIVRLLLETGVPVKNRSTLMAAIEHGGNEIIRLLVKSGVTIDGGAMVAASMKNDRETMKLFLAAGADINANNFGIENNALQAAAEAGHKEMVRLLLEHGASVHIVCGYQGTAMAAASRRGHLEIVQILLEAGSPVTIRNGESATSSPGMELADMGDVSTHQTPLQLAAAGGHLEIVQLLVEHGADPNEKGGSEDSPIMLAISHGQEDIVKFLLGSGVILNFGKTSVHSTRSPRRTDHQSGNLERAYNNDFDGWSETAGWSFTPPDNDILHQAVLSGNAPIVKLLSDLGADLKALPSHLVTTTAQYGHVELLRFLLQAGAAVDVQEVVNQSFSRGDSLTAGVLLNWAASHDISISYEGLLVGASTDGHGQLVRLLLESGVDGHGKDNAIVTLALPQVIYKDRSDLALLLLRAGANGMGLLGIAAKQGLNEVVKVMLGKYTSTSSMAGDYNTVLEAASMGGHEHTIKMVLELARLHSVKLEYNSALVEASAAGHEKIVKILLEQGTSFNMEAAEMSRAILPLLRKGNQHLSMILLEACSLTSEYTNEDSIMLQTAAQEGLRQVVELFLQRAAKLPNKCYEYGYVLQAAACRGRRGIIELLLQHDAALNAPGQGWHDMLEFCGNAIEEASYYGDPVVIDMLLKAGADVNLPSQRHGSALAAASAKGHKAAVTALLRAGADVNASPQGYDSSLNQAAHGGFVRIMCLLLAHGASINSQSGKFFNALEAAASGGSVAAVRLLLDRGVDVNTVGGFYGSALQAAASHGQMEVAKLLLARGADINMIAGSSGSALQAAIKENKEEMIGLLLKSEGVNANIHGGEHGNALQAAMLVPNSRHLVYLLLKAGADINTAGGEYGTALQTAVSLNDADLVSNLLGHGADVNAQGGRFGNALQCAAMVGNSWLVNLLLQHGADVNMQGGEYGTALQAACTGDPDEIFDSLLACGADVNINGGVFGNALQAASSFGKRELVEKLLEKGANVNAKGGMFGTALNASCYKSGKDIIDILIKHGADVNCEGGELGSAIQTASYVGDIGAVKTLLDNDADVNIQGGKFGDALQAACIKKNEEIAQLLLDNGAQVNNKGGALGCALSAASYAGSEALVKKLIEYGASVNALGGYYGTPLQAATTGLKSERDCQAVFVSYDGGVNMDITNNESGLNAESEEQTGDGHRESIIKLLLQSGADANCKGGEYGSALQRASWSGDNTIVSMLIGAGASVNLHAGCFGSALLAAVASMQADVVQCLLNLGADVNIKGGYFGNPLQAASNVGHYALVQMLINSGADVNSEDQEFEDSADNSNHTLDVETLIQRDYDDDVQVQLLGPALQIAATRGYQDIVQLLLESGADVDAQSKYSNQTALSVASFNGHYDTVEMLLNAGADINRVVGCGTPLYHAARGGHVWTVKVLVDHGAIIELKSERFETPVQVATRKGHENVVFLLKRALHDPTLYQHYRRRSI